MDLLDSQDDRRTEFELPGTNGENDFADDKTRGRVAGAQEIEDDSLWRCGHPI